MKIADVNYIMQYQLNFSYIEEGNITFWYRADFSLHLNNTKQDYVLQPHWPTSSLKIRFTMHLTVKLSENNFHHDKSSCKLENLTKNVLAIIFVNLVS